MMQKKPQYVIQPMYDARGEVYGISIRDRQADESDPATGIVADLQMQDNLYEDDALPVDVDNSVCDPVFGGHYWEEIDTQTGEARVCQLCGKRQEKTEEWVDRPKNRSKTWSFPKRTRSDWTRDRADTRPPGGR